MLIPENAPLCTMQLDFYSDLVTLGEAVVVKYVCSVSRGCEPPTQWVVGGVLDNEVVVSDDLAVCCMEMVVKTNREGHVLV